MSLSLTKSVLVLRERKWYYHDNPARENLFETGVVGTPNSWTRRMPSWSSDSVHVTFHGVWDSGISIYTISLPSWKRPSIMKTTIATTGPEGAADKRQYFFLRSMLWYLILWVNLTFNVVKGKISTHTCTETEIKRRPLSGLWLSSFAPVVSQQQTAYAPLQHDTPALAFFGSFLGYWERSSGITGLAGALCTATVYSLSSLLTFSFCFVVSSLVVLSLSNCPHLEQAAFFCHLFYVSLFLSISSSTLLCLWYVHLWSLLKFSLIPFVGFPISICIFCVYVPTPFLFLVFLLCLCVFFFIFPRKGPRLASCYWEILFKAGPPWFEFLVIFYFFAPWYRRGWEASSVKI